MDATPSKRKADESPNSRSPNKDSDQPSTAQRKKLKVADLSAKPPKDTTNEESPLHLPAPVWGHVLDYMPYEEARSALLVGKIIANEAVQYVHTLNFKKSCQLDVPSARRFPNVEHVNILCLLLAKGEGHADRVICESTSMRMVPVLTAFSRLKSLFAGGFYCYDGVMYQLDYFPRRHTGGPDNHMELFRGVVRGFLGAFQSKLLPSSLESMGGITNVIQDSGLCEEAEENGTACSSCRCIISYFPLADLVRFSSVGECVDEAEYFRLLKKRSGAKELFKKHSAEKLIDFLNDSIEYYDWFDEADSHNDAKALTKRIQHQGIGDTWGAQYLPLSPMRQLDALIDAGFDPKVISKADLYQRFRIGISDRPYDVFAKTTFDALVSRGFHFEETDLIVLDETKEPALKGLSRRVKI